MTEFSIIVPAFNEEENLEELVKRIAANKIKFNWNCELIIVNDNSSDKTSEIAEENSKKFKWIRVINRKNGLNGMGYALLEGTKNAESEIIVWTMCDLSDDLEAINLFVKKIKEEKCDMVIGSRFMKGGSPGDISSWKALAGRAYTLVTTFLFGIKANDITNAFRGFTKKVARLKIDSGDFAISPEQVIKTSIKGYKICEVPVVYKDRVKGEAKFNFFKMGIAYAKLFKYKWVKF